MESYKSSRGEGHKTSRSRRSVVETYLSETLQTESKRVVDGPSTLTFEQNLKKICLNYSAEFDLRVKRDLHRTLDAPGPTKKFRPRRLTMAPGTAPSEEPQPTGETDDAATIATGTTQLLSDDGLVTVNTVYDHLNQLGEIYMTNQKEVPRIVLQVIGLLAPYYPQLANLTFRRCKLNKYTIPELTKIVEVAPITELCFDDSSLEEGNYAMLLEKTSSLRVLSLARCRINDLVCEQIAIKLTFGEPACKDLQVLNLSSNRITDEGAKCFAFVLRGNRSLRHLNLAGNMITDDGAISILESLMNFPLTYEEYIGRRVRYSEHVKHVLEVANSYQAERVDAVSVNESAKPATPKEKPKSKNPTTPTSPSITSKADAVYLKQQAETLANEIVGPFIDHFCARSTYFKDGFRFCIGNLTLASLNLSFNNLCYPSLKKLLEVVQYQTSVSQVAQAGLLRPVIDGNNLPVEVVEYKLLRELLGRYVGVRPKHRSERSEKKTRASMKKGESKVSIREGS